MTHMREDYLSCDKIYIRDLTVDCIIGINKEERVNKQKIIINIILYTDTTRAARTDSVKDAADYKKIKINVISFVKKSSFSLLEKLASRIASICLKPGPVKAVKITIDKPGALRFAKSVAVEITREK